jgi:competence protein ComGC
MKKHPGAANEEAAFSLPELCVVIVCVAVLFSLLAPALAATKTQSAAAGCLSNLRQLMTGWEMYREESNDYLMSNAPLGPIGNNGWINGNGGEAWVATSGNIDPSFYTNALMWRYVKNNLSVFHCPGDVVPSDNGMRIRSYSMNGAVGTIYDASVMRSQSVYLGWRLYAKGADILSPSPSGLFVFADESPLTINDGFFEEDLNGGSFPNLPANYLEGGCGFSFADGHGEIHRWLTSVLLVPIQYGQIQEQPISIRGQNADYSWLRSHASSH